MGMLNRLAEKTWDPKRAQISCWCVCGSEVRTLEAMAGQRGRCPSCNRPLRLPGDSREGGKAGARQAHAMLDFKVATFEPNLAERGSDFYMAQMHARIVGFFHVLFWANLAGLVVHTDPRLLGPVGFTSHTPLWLAIAWTLALFGACSLSIVPVATTYARYSGRRYADSRIRFAAVGGYDIARWTPILVFAGLFALYRSAPQWGTPEAWTAVRNPWIFLAIGLAAAQALSWLTARQVFRAKFN